MKTIPRDQVNTIIKNGQAKGFTGKQVLDELAQRGYVPEGVDPTAVAQQTPELAPKEGIVKDTVNDVLDVGKGFAADAKKRFDNIDEIRTALNNGDQGHLRSILQTVGQLAGAGADAIGQVVKGAVKVVLPPAAEKAVKDVVGQFGKKVAEDPGVQSIMSWYSELPEASKRDIDAVGGVVNLVSNFVGGEVASKGGSLAAEAASKGINVARTAAEDAAITAAKGVQKATGSVGDTILAPVTKAIDAVTGPDVADAVKVSLNPEKALKGTGQDILVSVKQTTKDGEKLTLKKLSELTPEEKVAVQADTAKNLDDFTKQAELFKKDRSVPEGSPVEIVGKRTDQALEVADSQRKSVGAEMGKIEEKYLANPLPVQDDTLKTFSDVIKNFENPKYGVSTQDAPLVRKLVQDFDALEKGGATIGERLEMVRAWQQYLRDARDAFGNFKENATVNSRIEQAVNKMRNETVDHISDIDKGYKTLRQQYAQHVELQKIGDSLLGKDGALGERIKGAATVKRAIQSNSDAGARQFLTKLKEVTGYDAIKEGDVALTAMENVGDYQGLSLLNIINEGKGGIVRRVAEGARNLLVGDDASRVAKYVKK